VIVQGRAVIPRPILLGLAIAFAAATVVYSASWMHYVRITRHAQLGIEFDRSEVTGETRVTSVEPGKPAERAGLEVGDRIVAVNHRPLRTMNPFFDAVSRGHPGDLVVLDVRRSGVATPLRLQATLGPLAPPPSPPPAQWLALQFLLSYQIPFVVVGLAVLFLRLDHRDAWLLALMFAGFVAGSPLLEGEPGIHPRLRGFAVAYMVLFRGLVPAVFYYFFATFPVSSPIERKVPWLKSLVLAGATLVVVPLSLWCLADGGSHPLVFLREKLGRAVIGATMSAYFLGVTVLGLLSLAWNSRTATPEARRKVRVVMWGMLCGFTPFLLMLAASFYFGKEYTTFPFWLWVPTVLLLFLLPISFAYAVVRHRVLEIPVLLKRSARYVLVQRGFVVLLFLGAAAAIMLFTHFFARFFQTDSNLGMALSAVFGIVLVWASAPVVKRGTERIDRAFFRSAYDARQILEDLASRSRIATSRSELAGLLEQHLQQALHPAFQLLYLEGENGKLGVERGHAPVGMETLSSDLPYLTALAERGQPQEMRPVDGDQPLPIPGDVNPECLVPILGRQSRLSGLLILGPRLSEEPYSGEDRRLLASAASQAGVAMENIALAEQMAERLEAERRAAQEMDIARQVQSKLLPQKLPPLSTLDYAGHCLQARAVGGDYYDFLDLGPGRVGFVLADIAGKGISAALLMANLQANLRSQYAIALENLQKLLQSVNRLFYESTEPNNYATLFFATYDDATRRLRYVNCGHNPPVLMRNGGAIERLKGTATVLGLFERWECSAAEVQLASGDLLVIYTDGITEAMDARNNEFGEARLMDTLRANQGLDPASLLKVLVKAVQQFSAGEQSDDLTLVVGKAR
jgi:sigma-B regulation protein RsbU (phosphoserine phosphatase)